MKASLRNMRVFSAPKTVRRSRSIDAGAIFASTYGNADFRGAHPAYMVNVLESPDAGSQIAREARYLVRSTPLLQAFMRVCETAALPELEPQGVTDAMLNAWQDYMNDPVGEGEVSGVDFERSCFRETIIAGEVFLSHFGERWKAICSEDVETGEVSTSAFPCPRSWKVGGREVGANVLRQVAHRTDPSDSRGRSMLAGALPPARTLTSATAYAGTGVIARSKIASTITAQAPSMGAPGASDLGGSGLPGDVEEGEGGVDAEGRIKRLAPGSLPLLEPGQKLDSGEVHAPLDKAYIDALKTDICAALGLSRGALESDFRETNFARARLSFASDQRFLAEMGAWWARQFRSIFWKDAMLSAVASGRVSALAASRNRPVWRQPYIEPPQPEAEAKALKLLQEIGLLDVDDERARRGMNPQVTED